MKKITIAAITILVGVSCTKKQCPVPTNPTMPDTTKEHVGIIGNWHDKYNNQLSINDSFVTEHTNPPFRYLDALGSIYIVFDDKSLYPKYNYWISNDTLYLDPSLHHPDAPFAYTRNK